MSYIFEWLIHDGHSEAALWQCDFDKLTLLFEMAQERRARAESIEDLAMLLNLHSAIGSCVSTEGHEAFLQQVNAIKDRLGIVPEKKRDTNDEKRNRREMAMRLQQIGAKLGR